MFWNKFGNIGAVVVGVLTLVAVALIAVGQQSAPTSAPPAQPVAKSKYNTN